MINIEDEDLTRVDSYIFTKPLDEIIINKYITLDKNNYKSFDNIIISNYGNRSREYFKNVLILVLYFNNIPDIYSLQPGTNIKLPDIESLLESLELSSIFDEEEDKTYIDNYSSQIPGINMESVLVTNKNNNSSNSKINTANPKLDITKKEVSYNKTSGIIKF